MAVRYGLLSTHPPTRCGLATFNAALAAQLTAADGRTGGIVRVTTADEVQRPGPDVVHTWSARSVAGWLGAAEAPQTPRRAGSHLLTWGLLGPGKGVEWALRAVALLQDLDPPLRFTVAGQTHPKVIARHGEAYRAGLHRLSAQLGVAHTVDYQPQYHDEVALGALIRSADVVVLPYDSLEQVTSGVLTEAVGAGIPVVATTFPHAVELLSDGRGLLVPHRNPAALATAIRRVLTDPAMAARLSRPRAPAVRWPTVAARYEALAAGLIAASAADRGSAARPAGSRS